MFKIIKSSKKCFSKVLDPNVLQRSFLADSKFRGSHRNFCDKQEGIMKYLNVAEKNDAAKTIAGLLSSGTSRRREGYSVYNKIYEFDADVKGKKCKMVMTSVSGHLLNHAFSLSYRNWNNVDPQCLFDAPINKVCPEDFQPIKRTLEREVKSCQGLIIWTDCDREGENIGFEIIDVCKAIKPNLTVYRAVFSEITTTAVRRALRDLSQPDKRKNDAVEVRSELDLRTGAAITRFQTLRLQKLFPVNISDKIISYGSCQIPTLGFVVERYKEVEAFVSEPFWKIKVIHTIEDLTVEFNWARNRLFDKQACEDYYLLCLADPKAKVESVTVKPKNKWRPQPLDTVELEKLGSRKLKLSAKETMGIAEKLYTKGFISYPRTETNQFSKDFDLKSLVEAQVEHSAWGTFAQKVVEWGPNPRNGNKSDQAHPPIHPTKMVTNLDGNEARVYELVVRHFLACVSKDAVGMETIVNIDVGGEKFHANGLAIHERNYLEVYIYDKWNVKLIHKYEQGQIFDPTEISMQEGATQAPPLLTEADLIALMEKNGIGTDATHAEHINTIKERGYIGVVNNCYLVPGVIGMGLYEGYNAMELALAKPVLRAEFENDLKKICSGEKDPKAVLREQVEHYKRAYQQIVQKITELDNKMAERINETPNAATANSSSVGFENNPNIMQDVFPCPKCKRGKMALRMKKNQSGHFFGCTNFPDCKHIIGLPTECKEPTVLDETCSVCGSSVKLLKFKFQNSYFKTLFNTPSGKYKLCLICDSKFRNTFNILLEISQPSGAIVDSGIRSSSINSSSFNSFSNSSSTTSSQSGPTRPSQPKPPNSRKKQTDPPVKREPSAITSKKKREPKQKTLTATRTSTQTRTSNNLGNDAALNDFFNNDDNFDDFLLEAENCERAVTQAPRSEQIRRPSGIPNETEMDAFFQDDDIFSEIDVTPQTGQSTSSNPRDKRQNIPKSFSSSEQNFDDSISIMFRENEDDGTDFAWGSGQRKKLRLSTHNNEDNFSNDDFGSWGSQALKNAVKCEGCSLIAKKLVVKKEGPNNGREFYVCSKSNGCKFFQWADEIQENVTTSRRDQPSSSRATANSNNWTSDSSGPTPNCNCGNEAKNLVVKKDGPNKGRSFYACSNQSNSCKFFQWGDENQETSSTANNNSNENSWGSSRNRTNPRPKKK